MQWTVSTTSEIGPASHSFTISTNSQDYFGAQICFPSSCNIPEGMFTGVDRHGLYGASLPQPYSALTGSLQDSVDLKISWNSFYGARFWGSGPKGNLSIVYQALGPADELSFPVDIPGNYSVHVLATTAVNNATGQFSATLNTIMDQRPYAIWGLESVIVASAVICLLGVVGAILGYRSLRRRRAPHPPREETADQDDAKHDERHKTRLIPGRFPPSATE